MDAGSGDRLRGGEGRLEAEVRYHLPAFGGRYTAGTPHAGFSLFGAASGDTLGWCFTQAGTAAGDLNFGIKAARRKSGTEEPEHSVRFQVVSGDGGFRPSSFAAGIGRRGDEHGRIDDDRHVQSASRARRMLEGLTRVPAALSLRSRTLGSHSSAAGRKAIRSSSPRRTPCKDCRRPC